jgi:1,4-dihydroxy-2-naphthoate octaprenyltransferase
MREAANQTTTPDAAETSDRPSVATAIPLRRALTVIPRVSPEQWRASSLLTRWMIASRAAVLVMTFSSAAAGGLLALLHGSVDATAWLLSLLGLLLAHAANNQLNDLVDSARGIDKGNYFRNQYGVHVIEAGLLRPSQLFIWFAVTAGAALAIGLYLLARVGVEVLWLLAAGGFLLLAYTYPLKQWGLGELAVLLTWGPLMTGGTHLVSTGRWDYSVALIGTVFALGPTTVIFGKHIDKMSFDRDKGVRTLPVRLGERTSRRVVIAMLLVQYASLPILALSGLLPWTVLLAWLAFPRAWRAAKVYAAPAPSACPPGYPESVWPLWYVSHAFVHARAFGLYFLGALLLHWLLTQL